MTVDLRQHRLKREKKKEKENKSFQEALCLWGGIKQDFSHFYKCKHQKACMYSEFYVRLLFPL